MNTETPPVDSAMPADSTAPDPGTPTPDVPEAEGVFDGIPEATYHADRRSLSVSGAKRLLPPSCPALFRWEQDNPQPSRAVFDFGSAAHKRVLGVGQEVRYIDAPTWQTNKAKDERAEAYAANEIPLLEKQRGVIEGMAAAILAHPLASALLDPAHGKAEQSLYATDKATGVRMRGRLDWIPNPSRRRLLLVDYKSADNANPGDFGKTAANLRYFMQDAWYRDLAIAAGLHSAPAFLFIVQMKTPPYLVSVIELDADAVELGRRKNRQALETYTRCMDRNEWPGFSDGVSPVSLPVWTYMQADEEEEKAA